MMAHLSVLQLSKLFGFWGEVGQKERRIEGIEKTSSRGLGELWEVWCSLYMYAGPGKNIRFSEKRNYMGRHVAESELLFIVNLTWVLQFESCNLIISL